MYKPILSALLAALPAGFLSAQCPAVLNCPQGNPLICDISGNDPVFWNEAPYTWSQVLETADLYEGTADLTIKILKCGGSQVNVSYVLLLDLDNDNLQETAVSSLAFPPAGIVYANNVFNQGYTGGDPLEFDKRPVPDTARFGFALEINTLLDTTFASVRWNSGSQNVLARLPEGRHRIIWRVEQAGIVKYCDYSFRVKDCQVPDISCETGVNISIAPGGAATLAFTQALEMVEDNTTPYNLLQLSMRKSGDGSGFPLNNGAPVTQLVYHCDDLGPHEVELWAKDRLGNVKSCETGIEVSDAAGNCLTQPVVCAHPYWSDTTTIQDVRFKMLWVDTAQKLVTFILPATPDGCADLNTLPPAASFSLVAEKDTSPLNGVSTFDMVLISRHILGLEVFNAPWKWIAADVNKSGTITTFDVLELRKLILGIYNKFPSNTSWRFFDANCVLPNNPLTGYCPSEQTFVTMPLWNYPPLILFKGVKTGDVNGNAHPDLIAPAGTDLRTGSVPLVLPDILLKAGVTTDIPLQIAESGDWLGFQFEMFVDPQQVVIEEIMPGVWPGFDENSVAFSDAGLLTASWFSGLPQTIRTGNNLLVVRLKARRDALLRDVLRFSPQRIQPEMYDSDKTVRPLSLRFAPRVEQTGAAMIFPPQPNPTGAGISIPLHLTQSEVVAVELADVAGNVLFREEKTLDEGSHLIEVPAAAFPRSGMYLWRVSAGEVMQSGKAIHL